MADVVKFGVTPDQLRTTATQFDKLATDYKAQCDALYRKLEELHAQWIGEDSNMFNERLQSYRPTLERMVELLRSFQTHLNNAASSYQSTETENANIARSLPGGF